MPYLELFLNTSPLQTKSLEVKGEGRPVGLYWEKNILQEFSSGKNKESVVKNIGHTKLCWRYFDTVMG